MTAAVRRTRTMVSAGGVPSQADLAALADGLRRFAPMGEATLALLASQCRVHAFDAGACLLRFGERATLGHFVLDGLVREFHLDAEGREHTRAFVDAGGFTGSLWDLLTRGPALTCLEATEPTRTLAFAYDDIDRLADEHPDLERALRRLTEALYLRKARRELDLLALSAGERLRQWQAEHGMLDGRITGRVLASYLGITPVHLSRLRREAASR